MKTLYFHNPGHFDARAMLTFGVNVKQSETAVGYFGTGFKYAVAIVLRLAGELSVDTVNDEGERELWTFTTKRETIRGEAFDVVYCNGSPAGFTTRLGINWEPWQAYRELYCNAIDEGGGVTDSMPPPGSATCIEVECAPIFEAWQKRAEYFLDPEAVPLYESRGVQIFEGARPHLYYRGVAASPVDGTGSLHFNFIDAMPLTEDRVLASSWLAFHTLASVVQACPDPDVVRRVLSAGKQSRELPFESAGETSAAFLDVCAELALAGELHNPYAERVLKESPKAKRELPPYLVEAIHERARIVAAGFATSVAESIFSEILHYLPRMLEEYSTGKLQPAPVGANAETGDVITDADYSMTADPDDTDAWTREDDHADDGVPF